MFGAFPKEATSLEIAKIISYNIFQMDGLTYEVPYSDGGNGGLGTKLNLFEEIEENIFEYIPPQNTNQIYTPKWVVQKMVQQLEDEKPGIFDDSSKTFVDLNMKSGSYITEVVKKMYNNEVIKLKIPDDYNRLKHILENQLYGLAPTEIIYRIAKNFIFNDLIKK